MSDRIANQQKEMGHWMDVLRWKLRPAVFTLRYLRHRLLPRASYADDGEDVAAWMLLGGISRFIDVGANNGVTSSNTALAALRGAHGLCFEPNPVDYSRLAGFYSCAPRVKCVSQGVSDTSGVTRMRSDGLLSAMTQTEDAGLTGLLAKFRRRDATEIEVDVERLSVWLDRCAEFQRSDLLSIDVEGHELNVLLGIDWRQHPKPARCFVIETHARGKDGEWIHHQYEAIAELLKRQAYTIAAASRNNTFWLHEEDLSPDRVLTAKSSFPKYSWFI